MTQIERRKGFEGIERRGNTFKITVPCGLTPSGKQKRVYVTFESDSKSEAKQWKDAQQYRAELKAKVRDGMIFDGRTIRFSDFFDTWCERWSDELTDGVLDDFKDTINREFMDEIGNRKLCDINAMMLNNILDDMKARGLKPSSIRKYFSPLTTVLEKAYKLTLIRENPCDRLEYPSKKSSNEIHAFSTDEFRRFRAACISGIDRHYPEKVRKNGRVIPAHDVHIDVPYQWLVYFSLAVETGLRRGEMVGLTWADIDTEAMTVSVSHATGKRRKRQKVENETLYEQYDKDPKTAKSVRKINISPEMVELLTDWKEQQIDLCRALGTVWEGVPVRFFDDQFIFITERGKQMDLGTPTHKFPELVGYYNDDLRYKAEHTDDPGQAEFYYSQLLPEITLHDLRHTRGSILINKGVDLATVSEEYGHADITTTARHYIESVERGSRRTSDIMRKELYGVEAQEEMPQITITDLTAEEARMILELRKSRA